MVDISACLSVREGGSEGVWGVTEGQVSDMEGRERPGKPQSQLAVHQQDTDMWWPEQYGDILATVTPDIIKVKLTT